VWNATPLPSNVIAEHDTRYRKKIETLSQLKATTDDAQRAEILVRGGQWGMAAEAFAKAVEKEPEKLQLHYRFVEALVQAGDRSRLGPACDDILKRFGNSGDVLQTMAVAGLCRLAPQALIDPVMRPAVRELALTTDDLQRADPRPVWTVGPGRLQLHETCRSKVFRRQARGTHILRDTGSVPRAEGRPFGISRRGAHGRFAIQQFLRSQLT